MATAKDFVFNLLTDSSKAEKGMDSFLQIAQGAAAGAAAAWAGAKVGDALAGAFDTEAAQAKLTASLGLLPEESERIGQVAGSLFANAYGENIGEVNTAVSAVIGSFAGMRDASAADLEDMTERALVFASAFDEDVARAAQVAGQMVTQGIAVDGVAAFDTLTVAMQKMPIALRGDLLAAVDEYGGYFSSLGISGDKAMGMLVAASADGMYGIDKTGDAIKEFGDRATDMSTSSRGAFELIGLNGAEMTRAFVTGGDVSGEAFAKVVDGLLSIEDPSLRANTAIALFGDPIKDLNITEIPEFLTTLQSTTGGLGEVAGATEKMTEGMGQTMESMITAKKRGLNDFLQGLVDIPGPLAEVTSGLMAFGPGAIEVLGAVGPFIALTAARVAGTAATTANTVATTANNVAWYASPVTWIVLAIVAAIALLVGAAVLLIANWDTVGPWFADLWSGIWDGVTGFFGMIADAFMNFHPLGMLIANWEPITTWIGELVAGWQGMIGDAMSGIGEVIGSRVTDSIDNLLSIPARAGEAWDGFTGMVEDGVRAVVTGAVNLWNGTLGALDFDMPWFLGGAHISFPKLNIPALAEGGIVSSPTLALIGEAGPEAVVPLSQYRGGSGGDSGRMMVDVPVNVVVDGRVLFQSIQRVEARNAY